MSSYDSTIDTLRGKITENKPISLWRHYPEVDMDIDLLVDATLKDLQKNPSDLLKLSPHGRYCTVDFGCKIIKGTSEDKASGSSSCTQCIVRREKDWPKITEFDVMDSHLVEQIKYVSKVAKETDLPIMMTLFAPTMVARKLSENQFTNHINGEHKKELEEALAIISKITSEYARACLDAGANGIFIAIQEADKANLTQENVKSILKYNSSFIDTVNKYADFSVLHVHGTDVYLPEAIEVFKPTAINWHDRTSSYNLIEARKIFKGGLLGGLDPDELFDGIQKSEFENLSEFAESNPLILAPGCVIWQGTPTRHLEDIFKYYK